MITAVFPDFPASPAFPDLEAAAQRARTQADGTALAPPDAARREAGSSGFGASNADTGSSTSKGSFAASGKTGFSGESFSTGSFTGYGKPRAVVKPKKTAEDRKPFIAQGLGSLNGVNGISRGSVKSAALEYGVGDRVRHLKYGDGTVTEIVDDPRDYKVTIQFDGAGQKIMYAAFAKLKKL